MTNLEALLHKETNPLNTAAKNYGKQYVLTAKEWIKVIKAIQEIQTSVQGIKLNGTTIKPDESGTVEINTISLQDLVTFIENSGYITREELDQAIQNKDEELVNYIKGGFQPKGDYLTKHQDLSEYAKKIELPTVPNLVSAFENDAQYLTKSDLDSIYEFMNNLDNVLNPLSVTLEKIPSDNTIIFSNQDSYSITIAGDVQRSGKRVEPDTVVLKLNDEVINDTEITPFTYTINKPQLGTYTFKYSATYGSQTAETTTSIKFVLPFYYGCSKDATASVRLFNDMELVTDTAQSKVTVLNLDDGNFLWICLPSNVKISRCKCNDFEFPLLDPVQITDQMGTYNCYRSANDLGVEAGKITLYITY